LTIPARWLPILCALALAPAAACGGGGGDSGGAGPNLSAIPSATLPAELPTVQPLGSGPIVTTGGANRYTIQSGDTFADIADRFGVLLEDLLAANPGVDPGGLRSGDVISLPEAAAGTTPEPAPTDEPIEEAPSEVPVDTPPPPPAETATPSSLGSTYIVVDGDSPQIIADKLEVSLESLVAANPGILDTPLQVGQVIIIPPQPTPAQ
jgi:LysM repeat protein